MGGSREGCLGWWHGQEQSLEKPLSSLAKGLQDSSGPGVSQEQKAGL